jgi:hypothetical protein
MTAKISQYDKRQTSYFQKLGSHVVSVGAPVHVKNDVNTSTIAKSVRPEPSVIAADFIVAVRVLSVSNYDVESMNAG